MQKVPEPPQGLLLTLSLAVSSMLREGTNLWKALKSNNCVPDVMMLNHMFLLCDDVISIIIDYKQLISILEVS